MLEICKTAQGAVLVNSVRVIHESSTVTILSIDTRTKYVQVSSTGDAPDGGIEIGLFATDRSLNRSVSEDGPTVFLLTGLPGDSARWRHLVQRSRYGGLIAFIRADSFTNERPPLWSAD